MKDRDEEAISWNEWILAAPKKEQQRHQMQSPKWRFYTFRSERKEFWLSKKKIKNQNYMKKRNMNYFHINWFRQKIK